MREYESEILLLGIGNLLWADEGFGVRALEAFHRRFEVPAGVELVDGGTQGLYLLGHVCGARRTLVFHAIDFGLPPATLRIFRDAEVPVWSGAAMSLHQASLQELLSVARLRDRFPESITLIGVQPEVLEDYGGSLSAGVRARVPEAVQAAVDELARWGFPAVERAAPLADGESLTAPALSIDAYESGRPGGDDACRVGDARFLSIRARNGGS
jgi:hydrogenase maturation protease